VRARDSIDGVIDRGMKDCEVPGRLGRRSLRTADRIQCQSIPVGDDVSVERGDPMVNSADKRRPSFFIDCSRNRVCEGGMLNVAVRECRPRL
jgi:hypothetical protein